jgi:predicted metal-dependent hydrolase
VNKQLTHNNQQIVYTLRRSFRTRRMRLAVSRDGAVTVTLPFGIRESIAEIFVRQKMDWLKAKIDYCLKNPSIPIIRHTEKEYRREKERARGVITALVERFSRMYGFRYHSISIRNQKTCWGSCSRKGNLNFNYRILYLPEAQQEYIIAHELCHLKEMNHSLRFWNLVAKIIPAYRAHKKCLQTHRSR